MPKSEKLLAVERVYGLSIESVLKDYVEQGLYESKITAEINEKLSAVGEKSVTISFTRRQLKNAGISAPKPDRSKISKLASNTPEELERRSKAMKERWQRDDSLRNKINKSLEERWADPAYVEFMSVVSQNLWSSAEHRDNIADKSREQWNSGHGEVLMATIRELWKDEEHREKMKDLTIERWKDPHYRSKMKEVIKSCWADPEYREKVMSNSGRKDTKIELAVKDILECLNIEYEHNAFLSFDTFYCFPDFKIANKIIECQGDFWHANPEIYKSTEDLSEVQRVNVERDKLKKKHYKEGGYEVLYLWETDFKKNLVGVKESIKNFLEVNTGG